MDKLEKARGLYEAFELYTKELFVELENFQTEKDTFATQKAQVVQIATDCELKMNEIERRDEQLTHRERELDMNTRTNNALVEKIESQRTTLRAELDSLRAEKQQLEQLRAEAEALDRQKAALEELKRQIEEQRSLQNKEVETSRIRKEMLDAREGKIVAREQQLQRYTNV